MNCAACGTANRSGRRFCGKCGSALEKVCAACGAANDADENFCGECGASLPTAVAVAPAPSNAPPAAPAQSQAERRHVTVLFADLVGFTPLAQQRDAEEVRELLSRYFDTARTVIGRYGGTIEKFIGDAVMAVWGVPTIRESDAERSVRAALELVDAVAAFGEDAGVPGLQARAGVLTGEAAITVGSVGEGLVAGDLVNTASRVQSVAEPGTVYVGEATRQATESVIVYHDTGTHELKGKSEPLRLWRAERVVAGSGGVLRAIGLEPPFVGRDRELRMLKEYLHGTAEEGTARMLSVVGLGGVGKSRLAWEFFKYVDGLSDVTYWHRGRCLAYGEGVAYWALSEMVRMRAGILENEPADAARGKLRRTVEEFVGDPEERRWVEPRLAHLLGLEDRVATDPRDLYAAWRFFFERLSLRHPTALVFEDLQWADSGLLDFIEYLLEWSRASPLLVLTLARPEIIEKRPGWAAGKRGVGSLYLEPLSAAAMDQLLQGMVPGLPDDLRARIRERAAGVPLYAVETVRMLLDRGLLVEEDGSYRATGSLESLEVPESLHALIAARLDSLLPLERQLLQDAAVLGKSFTADALRSITAVPAASVDTCLSGLVGKDLLAIQSDPRSPERGQYVFLQDLVRSVAYGTLARRDRKLRHLAAVGHLESGRAEDEEAAEVVAAHLVEAYDADREAPDAAAILERARAALVRAGDHAASLAAAAAAQHYYERALALADEADHAALHGRAGEMAWLQLHGAAARAHFEEAEACHRAAGRAGAAARIAVRLAAIDAFEFRRDRALERVEQAFAALMGEPRTDEAYEADLALVAAELARRLYFQRNSSDTALERVELALEIAERLGLTETFCEAVNTKGLILGARGRRAEGLALVECALEHALAAELHAAAMRAYNNLSASLQGIDLVKAQEYSEDFTALAQRLGDRRSQIDGDIGTCSILVDLGRWDDALAIAGEYGGSADESVLASQVAIELEYAIWVHLWRGDLAAAERLRDQMAVAIEQTADTDDYATRAVLAALHRAHGDDAAALRLATRAVTASGMAMDDTYVVRWNLQEAAEAALSLGELGALEELLAIVRGRFRAGMSLSLDGHLLRYQARLSAARGDVAGAIVRNRQALEIYRRMQMPFWTAVTELELSEWLTATGRRPEAADLLREARITFERLEARPWSERAAAASTEPATAAALPA